MKLFTFKTVGIAVGGLFAVAHVGLLGYLMQETKPDHPVINFPSGDYSSYEVESNKDGYKIKFKANDPAILESNKSLEVDRDKKGLFGGRTERRIEYRTDQFTMDGIRNIGGATTLDGEGKSAKDVECIVADAGARSQGAMAGSAIAAGVAVPALSAVPYVGWLAGGWALMLGQKAGSEIGSEIGGAFNDC